MADQTQSPPSQPGIAVTGLTYPTTLTGSPYQQNAPILELNTVGTSVLVSGLGFPNVVGGEVSYQPAPVLRLQVAGASVELVIGSGGGEGDTAPPTTGQIWPRGLC